ncbi:TonB-dependent receptor [Niabella pedocola]|uniref:TonB-dependent receptor n=1 Tax=Niabella pedocola TaxID=1752077 RepID=A0ABS8PNI5_9BACT|nr:TonB-dependent receptor [Niabella pedocola]MCD2421862.1 TonB-dependent receptor [Niabella pedocola]
MRRINKQLLVLWVLCCSMVTYAQNSETQVTGIVRDEGGQLLPGITITAKGTQNSVATDSRGAFQITVPLPGTIVISGVGYEISELKLTDQSKIDATLKSDVKGLSDVVVVGYGTQRKDKVTGAIATVKMDDILGERPVSTTASLLRGVVPGLQVTIPSGRPGEGASINIRGGTDFGTALNASINTGAPLILVDNTVFDGPLNLIDPNDIETITVLKDAGSAAIYGSRSAYGVVLITTKKGKKNQKPQFNYSNNIVFATPDALPRKATPQRSLQALIDGGLTNYSVGQGQDLKKWIALISDYHSNPQQYPGGYATDNGIFYNLKGNDAVGDILGNASRQFMNNLSISGGSDRTTYRIALGTTNEKGILVPSANADNFKRYNIRSAITTDVTKWMNVQLDANYTYANTRRPGYADPYTYAVRIPSFLAEDSIPGYSGQIATGKNLVSNTYPTNFRYDQLRMIGRIILKPATGLSVTGEASYDNYHALTSSYNKLIYLRDPYGWSNQPFGNDMVSKNNEAKDYITTNIFATYSKVVQKHTASLMAGFNQEFKNYEQEITSKTQPINQELPSISTSTGDVTGVDNYSQFATRGFFGRLNYDYDNRYLLELNGRYDGSSRFPEGHRWTFAPSASLGWRLTGESFMQFIKPVINDLKLRATFGTVANQNIGEYQFMAAMNPTNPSWLNNGNKVVTVTTPGLISPDYTWETVTSLNYGITIAALKNRLTADVDLYTRNTKGILSTNNTPVPAVLGTSAPLINSASLKTNGFEIAVNWRDKIGKVAYYLSANLYDFASKVTKVNNPNNLLSQLYVGQKMGDIWGYVTDRFYTVDDFETGSLDAILKNGKLKAGIPRLANQSPNPGDIMYKDLDTVGTGNGIINQGLNTLANPGDRRVIGNNSLRYQFGIRGGLSCYNFDFSFVIAGVLKNDQFSNSYLFFPNNWQVYGALYENQLNYWTPDNPDAYFGRIYTTTPNGTPQTYNEQVQSRFILNGAYLRVQNLTLRYNVPPAVFKQPLFTRLSVAYSIENPFIWDHMPRGMYPDINNLGAGLGYPLLRKSSIGINLNF